MKYKHLCTAGLAIILLALFLPVLYYVITVGNGMNYNEDHKITTLYPNTTLFVCAALGAVLVVAFLVLLRKIPFNRHTVTGMVIFSLVVCVVFYAVNVKISKCIAFYGGWDCGMVAKSARRIFEGKDLGYDDYYTIFTNNVPITWLLYKLYCISNAIPGYPYNPEFIWIQFQCLMFAAAIFLAVMTVLVISREIAPAVVTLAVGCLLLGLSPWQIIPYTDASTIAAPALVLFLYALSLRIQTWWRYVLWFGMAFMGVMGGIMKANCYVVLIAILAVELVWIFFQKESVARKCREYALRVVLLVCAFLLASWCKNGMYETLDYEYDYDTAITWRGFLYDGLFEETTGACSDGGYKIAQAFTGQPRHIRDQYEMRCIKERLEEKGLRGLLDFWLRKSVMNFNDGTFSWFQEGFFNAWEYENIIESSWKEPLRDFYWEDGEDFLWFTTISQGLWFFILLGIVAEAVLLLADSVIALKKGTYNEGDDSPEMRMRVIGIVFFIGMFLFVMLFEGRARYLFNICGVFAGIAVMGYYKIAGKIGRMTGTCQ